MRKIAWVILFVSFLYACNKQDASPGNCWQCSNMMESFSPLDSTHSNDTYTDTLCDKTPAEIEAYEKDRTYPKSNNNSSTSGPNGTNVVIGVPYGTFYGGSRIIRSTCNCTTLQ